MRDISERAESQEINKRCNLINSCLGDAKPAPSDGITFTGKRSYVGILYRINTIIHERREINREDLVNTLGICWVDIRDYVRKLTADGAITDDYKKNSHHILRAAK